MITFTSKVYKVDAPNDSGVTQDECYSAIEKYAVTSVYWEPWHSEC